MSEKLLEDLEKSLENANKNAVSMSIKEVKSVKKEIKDIKKDDNITNSDKKKARRKIKILNEQASQVKQPSLGVGKGSSAKANPRPPNINKDGVRCFIRYNNMGVPYRICNDAKGKKPQKPPAQITPQISPDEFANKHGGYSNLTESQVREYHRLDMRERREEEYKAREKGEKFIKQFREERKRQRKKDANLKEAIKDLKKEGKKIMKKQSVKGEKGETPKSKVPDPSIKVSGNQVLVSFD